jgi:hypothetical protein
VCERFISEAGERATGYHAVTSSIHFPLPEPLFLRQILLINYTD